MGGACPRNPTEGCIVVLSVRSKIRLVSSRSAPRNKTQTLLGAFDLCIAQVPVPAAEETRVPANVVTQAWFCLVPLARVTGARVDIGGGRHDACIRQSTTVRSSE